MVDSIVMDRIISPDLSTNVWECFYDQGGDFWSIRKLNDCQKIWICCISGGEWGSSKIACTNSY